ncbi:MAG: hypothetical protein ACE5I3_15955, partial [Phycisphaerae bacterium]
RPADVGRRAALVDALAGIGTANCAEPLLGLLNDHRSCGVQTRSARLLERIAPLAARGGLVETPLAEPTSRPLAESSVQTIAERAAAALARITRLRPPFASALPDAQRADAERVWRDWVAAHREAP